MTGGPSTAALDGLRTALRHLRIRISIQPEEVQFGRKVVGMDGTLPGIVHIQARAVGIFVGIEQNVDPIVFVVTVAGVSRA